MTGEALGMGVVLQGRYEIVGVVGRGGMGTVYRSRDTRLDCTVAVKEMNQNVARDVAHDEAVAQFEQEARILAQLSHPNLPRVTDYFVEGDRWYLILEYIEGITLEELWRQHNCAALPMSDVVGWGVQVADVLAYLHSQKPPVVFRDVKPANIMLQSDGLVRLIDFGIARRFEEGVERDTVHYGSPGYSPPEQYGRIQTDPRSDIYALGATLHHLLTGVDPSGSPFRFATLRSLVPDAPVELENLLRQCLAVDVGERCQSAGEVRDRLVQVRAALPAMRAPHAVAAVSAERPQQEGRTGGSAYRQSHRHMVWGVAGMLLGVAAVTVAVLAGHGHFLRGGRYARPSQHVAVGQSVPQAVAPDASAAPTTLRITSSPSGAQVALDGEVVGVTPLEMSDVEPGTHHVIITAHADSGALTWSRDIAVDKGQTVVLDVPLDAPAMEATPAATASAVFQQIDDRVATAPARFGASNGVRGVLITATCRVNGAVGKAGTVAVYFYGADGVTPLRPAVTGTHYQNTAGQLASAVSFVAVTDPSDVPIELFVPGPLFGTFYSGVYYRLVVSLDGRQVGVSDLVQFTP